MATQNLELFYKPTCPYCHKVMSFMEQNNIELPMHDIVADDAARERLIEVGGKRQSQHIHFKCSGHNDLESCRNANI